MAEFGRKEGSRKFLFYLKKLSLYFRPRPSKAKIGNYKVICY